MVKLALIGGGFSDPVGAGFKPSTPPKAERTDGEKVDTKQPESLPPAGPTRRASPGTARGAGSAPRAAVSRHRGPPCGTGRRRARARSQAADAVHVAARGWQRGHPGLSRGILSATLPGVRSAFGGVDATQGRPYETARVAKAAV